MEGPKRFRQTYRIVRLNDPAVRAVWEKTRPEREKVALERWKEDGAIYDVYFAPLNWMWAHGATDLKRRDDFLALAREPISLMYKGMRLLIDGAGPFELLVEYRGEYVPISVKGIAGAEGCWAACEDERGVESWVPIDEALDAIKRQVDARVDTP